VLELPISRWVNKTPVGKLELMFLLGLPAFKPGEKVEIDFGMDDI
jgi:hypothetical protein